MSEYVEVSENEIKFHANNAAEAKLAIKELKLKKKEFSVLKQAVVAEQKRIRAQYTTEVRTRGSMARGGGGFGRIVRSVQSASRDSRRAQLARDLAPLEKKKQKIDATMRAIDQAIIQLESALLKQGG